MKRIPLLFVSFFLAKLVISQQLSGTFKYRDQHLKFKGDTVTFLLSSGGCIVYTFEGIGTYRLSRNHLIIKAIVDDNYGNVVEIRGKDSNTVTVDIQTEDTLKYSGGATVSFFSKRKLLGKTWSNYNNQAQFQRKYGNSVVDSVVVDYIGYRSLPIIIKDHTSDYSVILARGYTKKEYEWILNTAKKGFKIRVYKDSIQIKRPISNCHGVKQAQQTFLRHSKN